MIFEYAVSPELFSSEERLLFLREAFGTTPGRLVSDFPRRDWEKLARAFIDKNAKDPTERHAWIEVLIAIRKYALHERQGAAWDNALDWLSNALVEHGRPGRAFRAILAARADTRSKDVLPVGISLSTQNKWLSPISARVPRVAVAIVREMSPLLAVSTTLVLVDRHFHPNEGAFVKVLSEFAICLLQQPTQPRIEQIKYVTAYDIAFTSPAAFQQACVNTLPSILPKGISVKFVLKTKGLLHDRYVITERCCIQFGQGLDEGQGEVQLSRLSDTDHRREFDAWDKNAAHIFIVSGIKV